MTIKCQIVKITNHRKIQFLKTFNSSQVFRLFGCSWLSHTCLIAGLGQPQPCVWSMGGLASPEMALLCSLWSLALRRLG